LAVGKRKGGPKKKGKSFFENPRKKRGGAWGGGRFLAFHPRKKKGGKKKERGPKLTSRKGGVFEQVTGDCEISGKRLLARQEKEKMSRWEGVSRMPEAGEDHAGEGRKKR